MSGSHPGRQPRWTQESRFRQPESSPARSLPKEDGAEGSHEGGTHMAVLLTDLIKNTEGVIKRGGETGPYSYEEYKFILAALKRYENCDGKHD